jgi:hypothetical protein
MKDALYNAERGKEAMKDIAANPLVEDGRKIIPSVTRVFSAQRQLYVYLQAYRGAATAKAPATAGSQASTTPKSSAISQPATSQPATNDSSIPLIAFVGLYRNQQKIFETTAKALTSQSTARLGTVPIRFDINLAGIAPGEYQCQVSILDPENHRVAFWVGPLALVP